MQPWFSRLVIKQEAASGLVIFHPYSACPSFTLMSSLGYLHQLPMPKDLELHLFPKSPLASAVHGAVFKARLGDKGELEF